MLTAADKAAIRGHTGTGYRAINRQLRNRKVTPATQRKINTLNRALIACRLFAGMFTVALLFATRG